MTRQIKQFILIGFGGMIGAISRYSISLFLENNGGQFPLATCSVNLIGCFLLSFLLNYPNIKQKISSELFIALSVGVIGSFTTFSTITIEVAQLWMDHPLLAILYILSSVFGGLIFCLVGYTFAKKMGEE